MTATRENIMDNHREPTYNNQLFHARQLLMDEGLSALDNPPGATGRMCKCGSCFCCAAAQVVKEHKAAIRS